MNKLRKNRMLALFIALLGFVLMACESNEPSKTDENTELTEIEFMLDWIPNTNHTGVFVAKELGYFEDAGFDVAIRRPPAGSATELVGLGEAEFGIHSQDSISNRFAEGVPVTAVASIIEHNTAGILSKEDAEIYTAADMEGNSYGSGNEETTLAMVQHIVEEDGGDFSKVEMIPSQADNIVIGFLNDMFDSGSVYYGWDGTRAETEGVPTNFFFYRDMAEELDFHSPIIIGNNDYLETNPEEVHNFIQAVKSGYQYAIENPEKSADILIKNAPELKDQKEHIHASQEWISKEYASDIDQWGYIDEERWNTFYEWLYENDLIEVDLTKKDLFTNEFLGD